jgi:hypothetical protein
MKAQITIFIILMLMVLVVFGILFAVIMNSSASKSKQQTKLSTEEVVAREKAEQRVKACLDESASQALKFIGQQGGVTFNNQQFTTRFDTNPVISIGSINDPAEQNNLFVKDNKKYSLWLKKPTYESWFDSSGSVKLDSVFRSSEIPVNFKAPFYPCTSVKKQVTYLGAPGTDDLAREITLDYSHDADCDYNSNILAIPVYSLSQISDFVPKLCDKGRSVFCDCEGCAETIQSRLERFASEYFKKCFASLPKEDYDMKIQGDVKTEAFFGDNTVDFEASPSIKVSSKDNVFDFAVKASSKRYNLKLKTLITVLNYAVAQDAYIASFDIRDGIKNYAVNGVKALPNTDVSIAYVHENNNYYSIVTVIMSGEDGAVDGNAFEFSFARQNRIPVLEYHMPLDVRYYSGGGSDVPFSVVVRASDPDENERLLIKSFFPGFTPVSTASASSNGVTETTFSYIAGSDKFPLGDAPPNTYPFIAFAVDDESQSLPQVCNIGIGNADCQAFDILFKR